MKTNQNTQQNNSEVEYITRMVKARHELIKLLKKEKMINPDIIEDITAEFDPCYGRIMPTGAIGVEFTYGYPHALFGAFGKLRLGIPGMADNWGNYTAQEKLFSYLKDKWGMKVVEPSFKKKGIGEFGPYCAVTNIPGDNKKLPDTFERVKNVDRHSYEIKEQMKRVNAILKEVSETVAKADVKAKKRKCVINNEKNKTDDIEQGL